MTTLTDTTTSPGTLRELSFIPHFQRAPEGSVLVSAGNTRVICAASVVKGVPAWMRAQNIQEGWLTAEYQMLPGATEGRSSRELSKGKPSGRSAEIQRLIGRSLRAGIDLKKIPGHTIYIDCDVLDADGGTRCASITGAAVALEIACQKLFLAGDISSWPLLCRIGAVSVGIVDGEPCLDLCYAEDVRASVDMNVVMTNTGDYVEIQGTAEGKPFSQAQMDSLLGLAREGLEEIFKKQNEALSTGMADERLGPASDAT